MKADHKKSAVVQILLALVPYTKQNLMLSFKPNLFFNELEKTSCQSASTLRAAFNRAKSNEFFRADGDKIALLLKGRQIVQPYIANQLAGGGQLMVIFDIPEDYAGLRRKLRNLLRQLGFRQIQQSVWMSDQDHRTIIADSVNEFGLQDWVQIYESARIL